MIELDDAPPARERRIRESNVEAYLVERVEALGGTAEKFKSPQKAHVPDRLVCWPKGDLGPARACFVECKRPGEKPTPAQKRDHDRRRAMGFSVYVSDSYEAVDLFIEAEGKQ